MVLLVAGLVVVIVLVLAFAVSRLRGGGDFMSEMQESADVLMSAPAVSPIGGKDAPTLDVSPRDAAPIRPQGNDVSSIRVGTRVSYGRGAGVVVGTFTFEEDGDWWYEHRIQDAQGQPWWLGIDGSALTSWEPIAVTGTPGATTIELGGDTFRLVESGQARFSAVGDTDTDATGYCDYHDYESRRGRLLGFERFTGGEWQLAVGDRLSANDISIDG